MEKEGRAVGPDRLAPVSGVGESLLLGFSCKREGEQTMILLFSCTEREKFFGEISEQRGHCFIFKQYSSWLNIIMRDMRE